MAITQAMCNSYKLELLQAVHDWDNDTFKIALYTSAATLGATTTAYSATNEIAGTGYSAGGETIAITATFPKLDTGVAILDFDDTSWGPGATFTTRGALIYNSSKSDAAVAVLDFGNDVGVSGGTFTITWPTGDSANAILRLA
jgi:hypothetical protein